jgi:hypothetical protein
MISFWPLDAMAMGHLSIADWVATIVDPLATLSISEPYTHLFQIFAVVVCVTIKGKALVTFTL